MLDTVKRLIGEEEFPSFPQFYQQYVMQIQDMLLDEEMHALRRDSTFNIYTLLKLASVDSEGW